MFFSRTKKDYIKKLINICGNGLRVMSVVKEEKELKEVKVDEIKDSYTVIKINPYTLEEEMISYPLMIIVEDVPKHRK